jgi:hypothetical protein
MRACDAVTTLRVARWQRGHGQTPVWMRGNDEPAVLAAAEACFGEGKNASPFPERASRHD